jgi:predicted MFS family arabinose efflux permease
MIPLRTRLGPLEERPFRLLWLGRTTSALGDALIPVALAFAVIEELDGSAGDLGLVFASFSLSRVLLTLMGGVWADRLQRRAVMLACDAVRFAVELLVFVLLVAGAMELWMLVATSAVFGGAGAFFGPASTGLVAELVSRARLQQANALLSMSETGTFVVGPALSGVLVAVFGPAWVFLLDALTFAASFAFLAAMRIAPRTLPEPARFIADLAAGWKEVRARTWLWASLIGFGLNNLAGATFFVLGPVVFEEELGGASRWGAALGIGSVGGLVGGIVALRWRPRRPLLASVVVWSATALPLAALAGPQPALVIGVAAAFSFMSVALGNTIWEAMLQEQIPNEVLSRVSSYDWLVSLVFQPLGFALAGPLAATVGTDTTLWAAAALSVAVHASLLLLPDVWRLRRPPDAATALSSSDA